MIDSKPSVISIIIPVYNVETYLRRCLDSILRQSHQQLDIVLVDDGSTDNSGKICDAYAKADTRIQAIHKENGGLSSARNAGLDKASGDYVTYVDSDDFIHPLFCERMLSYAKKHHADIVQCDILKGTADRFDEQERNEQAAPLVVTGREALLLNQFKVTVWAKLYSYAVVERFRFHEGIIHEDDDIYYKYGYAAQQVCMAPDPLYYYYQSPNSITRIQNKRDELSIVTPIYEDRIRYFLGLNDPQMVSRSIDRYCVTLMLMYMEDYKHPLSAQYQKSIYQTFCDQYAHIRSDSNISKQTRLMYSTFQKFPNVSAFIVNALRLRKS